MNINSSKEFDKAESKVHHSRRNELSAFAFELCIGFDGKRAANNTTGLGNYSRSLMEHLAKRFPLNQYYVYTPKAREEILKLSLFGLTNLQLKYPVGNKFFWRSVGIKTQLVSDKIDLYHGLSQEIPFGINKTGIKSIVTIHDLIFLRYPQYYKPLDASIYRFKSKYACKNADRIIAISEKTKADIIAFYKIEPSKIEVIYQSCDDSFKVEASEATKKSIAAKHTLPNEFLLNVGTIEPRKNLLLIIKALAETKSKIPLVVIGKAKPYLNLVKDEVIKRKLQERIIFLNDVPFADLPVIYQMAKVFIYPSFYEGFGIPIIEALYSAVPVIGATGSCLEEAGGPDSLYVNPTDVRDLASKIDLVLKDEELRENMIKRGLAYVQKFNVGQVTQQLMACYQKTLKN